MAQLILDLTSSYKQLTILVYIFWYILVYMLCSLLYISQAFNFIREQMLRLKVSPHTRVYYKVSFPSDLSVLRYDWSRLSKRFFFLLYLSVALQ